MTTIEILQHGHVYGHLSTDQLTFAILGVAVFFGLLGYVSGYLAGRKR